MVRTRLNIGCRYSTPVRERPLHPTRSHSTPEPSQTQAPVTPATEPEQRAGGSLTTPIGVQPARRTTPIAWKWLFGRIFYQPHTLPNTADRDMSDVPGRVRTLGKV